ncbi:NADH-quinone oxidoreductase subunit NuoN [Haloferax sp. MBLA0076]|uniref:NADH-quinone oxidoreductase subunit NuoN n=1 Tax=Haloferax litoreum TaxID=2666140 RepID=A0A6A8GE04_9EURY|nr:MULTISPECIES: NADH-quinone oxidoreductase subunit N [Haloferax]KAB1191949.1 NADH-quinone oxidoreductase subunit N [Haloferax sp. CBA1148]MRX20387.1 NADH-quinone oxidoreductase subunit NuoN [Haloferax litoreum]
MTPLQTLPDWTAMAPAIVLGLTGLLLLIIDTVDPETSNNGLLAGVATLGSLGAGGIAGWFLIAGTGMEQTGGAISLYGDAIVVDGMSLFFTLIFTSVAAMVSVASYDYLADQRYQGEFYSLVLFAATGMTLMAMSNSLATVFVSLELASLPSYALVAFLKKNRGSVEAGLKYFLIGALSSAVFAFGISLVFAVTGSLVLPDVAANLSNADELVGVLGLGVLMIAGGFAFKTASVPFHFWAPEAYEGAPAPVSAFLSSASKAAGFAVAFRVFTVAFPLDTVTALGGGSVDWSLLFALLAVVTMTLGNFAAATQENVKRMLAYSSIGHAGYALIGLAAITVGNSAANGDVLGASMAHLLVYGFMNTGAFLFIAMAEKWGIGRTFEDYNGLATKVPIAATAMTIFMFSLAGLPPFGGFVSKYALFYSAIESGFWWLAAVGAVNSALSLFYYSRVVKAMWIEEPSKPLEIGSQPVGLYVAVIFAAVGTVLLLPGFQPVIETAQTVAAALF